MRLSPYKLVNQTLERAGTGNLALQRMHLRVLIAHRRTQLRILLCKLMQPSLLLRRCFGLLFL